MKLDLDAEEFKDNSRPLGSILMRNGVAGGDQTSRSPEGVQLIVCSMAMSSDRVVCDLGRGVKAKDSRVERCIIPGEVSVLLCVASVVTVEVAAGQTVWHTA